MRFGSWIATRTGITSFTTTFKAPVAVVLAGILRAVRELNGR